jgi:hypothetical protein
MFVALPGTTAVDYPSQSRRDHRYRELVRTHAGSYHGHNGRSCTMGRLSCILGVVRWSDVLVQTYITPLLEAQDIKPAERSLYTCTYRKTLELYHMDAPTSTTKVASSPVAAPHPRIEKSPIDKSRDGCTATTEEPVAPSQEPQGWDQVAPRLGPEIVLEREENIEVFFESGPPLSHAQIPQPTMQVVKDTDAGASMDGWEKSESRAWPVPHAVEYQKHAWYASMISIGGEVKDEWGFSSAGVSRSHSPISRH